MIVLDIETTGTDPKKHCMLSLGAVDYDSGEEFYGECSVYSTSVVDPVALEINGFKGENVQPGKKQFPHDLYLAFEQWSAKFPDRLLAGHNIGHLDLLFIEVLHDFISNPYFGGDGRKFPFGYRTLDLHSVAFAKLGRSLSHEGICTALGLPKEPNPHNALAGARSEREAFLRLL